MATATATASPIPETALVPGEMVVVLSDIGWSGFEQIVRLKGERHTPRLVYSEGALTLMSPSHVHEHGGDRLDRVVMAICAELDIPCHAAGATLFRRRDLDKGIEGDKTYYLTHEEAIRGKDEIDLNVDPPPDLAIEVEVTHSAGQAIEIWRQLGVPEVWIYSPRRSLLRVLQRDGKGNYLEASASRFFPFLKVSEILDWLAQAPTEPQSRWERRLRNWVREELVRRMGGGAE